MRRTSRTTSAARLASNSLSTTTGGGTVSDWLAYRSVVSAILLWFSRYHGMLLCRASKTSARLGSALLPAQPGRNHVEILSTLAKRGDDGVMYMHDASMHTSAGICSSRRPIGVLETRCTSGVWLVRKVPPTKGHNAGLASTPNLATKWACSAMHLDLDDDGPPNRFRPGRSPALCSNRATYL